MPKVTAKANKANKGRGNSPVKSATLGGDDLRVGDEDEDEDTGTLENPDEDDDNGESDEENSGDENSGENSEDGNGEEDPAPKGPASTTKSSVMTPKGPVRTTLTKITMLDTIQSPRIGKFYLSDVVGSKKMIKGSSYMVPTPAARVLIGNKKAV